VASATIIPLPFRIQRVQLDASAGVSRHDDVPPCCASAVLHAVGALGIRLNFDRDYERECLRLGTVPLARDYWLGYAT